MHPEDADSRSSRNPPAPAEATPEPEEPDAPASKPQAEAPPPPAVLHPHDLRDVPWQKGPKGVKEKRRRHGSVIYRLIVYPGGYAEETPTDRQQIGLVLSGRGRLLVGRRQRPLRASQSLILPRGLSRKLRVGRNPLILFVAEPAGRKRKRRRRPRAASKSST